MLSVKQGGIKYHFGVTQPGIEQTHYSLSQLPGIHIYMNKKMGKLEINLTA